MICGEYIRSQTDIITRAFLQRNKHVPIIVSTYIPNRYNPEIILPPKEYDSLFDENSGPYNGRLIYSFSHIPLSLEEYIKIALDIASDLNCKKGLVVRSDSLLGVYNTLDLVSITRGEIISSNPSIWRYGYMEDLAEQGSRIKTIDPIDVELISLSDKNIQYYRYRWEGKEYLKMRSG